jgi:uncharacterized membrane protein YqhA
MERQGAASTASTDRRGDSNGAPAPFARLIGRTRYIVLLAVAAVMLVAICLFILGVGMAVVGVWQAGAAALRGELDSTRLTVDLPEIVSVMLKAVVFYSLFIAPLNLTAALGVESFYDLENKLVSIIIVIMGVTFLEHFIAWERPAETFIYGVAMAAVVAALVLFQRYSHQAREDQRHDVQEARAQHDLFERDTEERRVPPRAATAASDRERP